MIGVRCSHPKASVEVLAMRRFVFGLAACVAVGLAAPSPGAPPDEQAKADPAKEFATIQKDWASAQEAFVKAYQQAKTNEERQQILKEKRPKPAEFADRCLKLVESHPDSPVAGEALAWIMSHGQGTPAAQKALLRLKEKVAALTDLEQLNKVLGPVPGYGLRDLAPQVAAKARKNLEDPNAVSLLVWVCSATAYGGTPEISKLYNDTVDLLVDRFAERPELAPLANWLAQDDDPPWAEKHLRRLIAKNADAGVKRQAKFGLASILKNKDEAAQPEAEQLFQALIEEAKNTPKDVLVERARTELADIKVHGIGKPVPEINGTDLDGKAFKLSDYKGKVVLLDFWGFW
jgi:hypothetical protein